VIYLIYQEEGKDMPKVNAVVVKELVAEELEGMAEVSFVSVEMLEHALACENIDLWNDLYKERHGCRP
jgi:hypothetical protein